MNKQFYEKISQQAKNIVIIRIVSGVAIIKNLCCGFDVIAPTKTNLEKSCFNPTNA